MEQIAGGYEIALKNAATGQFSIWNTDSGGNFSSFNLYSGTSVALETLETSFNQDLNGDGTIGVAAVAATVIEASGSTKLDLVGSNYFFFDPVGGGTGPVLKYAGANVVAGQFNPFTPVGVEQITGGYEIALKNAGTGQFSIWNTDSSGNFVSFNVYAGTSTALETLETSFSQDLNGDGTIGIPGVTATVIEEAGSTKLDLVGSNYFFDPVSGGSGPALKYAGANVVVGQFSPFAPVGVEQITGGYEIALKNAGTGQFSIWNTDSSGNFVSFNVYAGTSTALETLETSFNQDLNGDGTIGIPGVTATLIEGAGSIKLDLVGSNYFFDPVSGGSGPALKYAGANVVAGQFSPFTLVGVEQITGGYEVALKNAGTGQFSIWNTDSGGNFVSFNVYAGTSTALETLETSFNQDLNGDGTTGIPGVTATLIEGAGSTKLDLVGSNYFFDPVGGGTGPALKYAGTNVAVGQFSPYAPVGVEQITGGYEVALKNAGAGQFSIWNTDSGGNFVSFNVYAGTSTALETLETSFNQDLNGDGVTGIAVNAGATVELAGAASAAVTFKASTGTLKLDAPSTFTGQIVGFAGDGTAVGSDKIDLVGINYNSVNSSYNGSTGILSVSDGANTASLHFVGSYSQANFKFANDGQGGTILYDPPATNPATTEAMALPGHNGLIFAHDFGEGRIAGLTPGMDGMQFNLKALSEMDAFVPLTQDGLHGEVVITHVHQGDFHLV